ncbi:Crp/Fnr family transcriptional regulator [Ferruginibacter sp.]
MKNLLAHISNYASLGSEAITALEGAFEKKLVSKNDLLLRQGQVCRHLYFVEKGALRGFYNLDGKEITHWFGFENDFVTSFHSFITHSAAVENIQLLEGSILWSISHEQLTALLNRHHEIERLLRIAYEKYYIRLEERFVNAHFKTAKELYENLLLQTPHIIERVPLGYIASYLGMSQETLSRIRNKI